MIKLKYTVENSQVANKQRPVEIDGEVGTMTSNRLLVDLLPVGHNGGTLQLDLPPETEGFSEGTEITVNIGASK